MALGAAGIADEPSKTEVLIIGAGPAAFSPHASFSVTA